MPQPSPTSATERLEAALGRIRSPDCEGSKVFIMLYEESARREAAASDDRHAFGGSLGPLDGRIVSIKDLLDVAGETTRSGSAVLRRQPPATTDAPIMQRLRAAGAVIVGKTQMTEFAFSALGTNPHDPAPGNPRDRARAPGGSSSGAVVSVVDGMAEIAIGSDTGGSIRIPASLSGAVGFKPTAGRIPLQGAFSLSTSLDSLGPIALSVADCAATDAVLSGDAALGCEPKKPDRLVVARGRLFNDAEPEVVAAFEAAVSRLSASGLFVVDGTFETILDQLAALDAIGGFPSIEVGATLRDLGVASLDEVDPKVRVRIEAGTGVLGVDYVRMLRRRAAAIAAFEAMVGEAEAFILPTTPIRAPLLADVAEDAGFIRANGLVLRNPRVANLLDCPSISLPAPVEPGALPVGLMLIGRRGNDRALLRMAGAVEAALAA